MDGVCRQCYRTLKSRGEYLVRIGLDRKKPGPYFGPYGLVCSLECAAKKDPVEWEGLVRDEQGRLVYANG